MALSGNKQEGEVMEIEEVRTKLQALGVAAGVFAQFDEDKNLWNFREIVNDVFNAAGIDEVDWEPVVPVAEG